MSKACLLGAVMIAGLLGAAVGSATAGELATAMVQAPGTGESASFDGVVEAVRQTVVSAQVPGAVTAIDVKVGDRVQAGQVLARIDARAAEQNVAASDAQVLSARATLEVATKEFDRQKQLLRRITPARPRSTGPKRSSRRRKRRPQRSSRRRTRHAPNRDSSSSRRRTAGSSPTFPSCWATWRCPAARC